MSQTDKGFTGNTAWMLSGIWKRCVFSSQHLATCSIVEWMSFSWMYHQKSLMFNFQTPKLLPWVETCIICKFTHLFPLSPVQAAVRSRSHIAAVGTASLWEPMDLPGNKSTPGRNPPWTRLCLPVGCYTYHISVFPAPFCHLRTYTLHYQMSHLELWYLGITTDPTRLDKVLSGLVQ